MTTEEFNEKYKDYLEDGFYGLSISNTNFINWLDKRFQTFIKIPGFRYHQIKSKFGYGRFYADGLSQIYIDEVEEKITKLYEAD